jgi:hypothetical protein
MLTPRYQLNVIISEKHLGALLDVMAADKTSEIVGKIELVDPKRKRRPNFSPVKKERKRKITNS